MKSVFLSIIIGLTLAASVYSPALTANDYVTCESKHQQYNSCPVQSHGYVSLHRQISNTKCVRGKNWDYDQRSIWVDQNCKGEFEVETRHHTDGHKDHSGKNAVAAAAAVALIAVVAANAKDDKQDKYNDDNYYGSRHTSYVPGWMVGDFKGYNIKYGSEVTMTIGSDGRVSAHVEGHKLNGYVNDERLYVGDAQFYIDRAGDGFNTTQVGNTNNQVHYTRR